MALAQWKHKAWVRRGFSSSIVAVGQPLHHPAERGRPNARSHAHDNGGVVHIRAGSRATGNLFRWLCKPHPRTGTGLAPRLAELGRDDRSSEYGNRLRACLAAGFIGRPPLFREAARGLLETDGIDTIADVTPQIAQLRPFVRSGLQILLVVELSTISSRTPPTSPSG